VRARRSRGEHLFRQGRCVAAGRIYGDGGYQGPKAAKAAAKTGYWTIEIIERSPTAVGFEVLPKRFERYARTVAVFIHL